LQRTFENLSHGGFAKPWKKSLFKEGLILAQNAHLTAHAPESSDMPRHLNHGEVFGAHNCNEEQQTDTLSNTKLDSPKAAENSVYRANAGFTALSPDTSTPTKPTTPFPESPGMAKTTNTTNTLE
jgi:hypothetical protein